MNEITQAEYILGHSQAEMRRLIFQAGILRPLTERLLQNAGIGSGMRVLDLGCGAGDVSMLAAELVGSCGCVIGIDRNPEVIALARERSQIAGFRNIEFRATALGAFCHPERFDCVVGRYILVHQTDPVGFLRTSVRFLRPGGIFAFHEINLTGSLDSCPRVRLWDAWGNLFIAVFQKVLPRYDTGNRLEQVFVEAGLPVPTVFRETPIGCGENSPLYAWLADTIGSVLLPLAQMGVEMNGETSIRALENGLRTAVVEGGAQVSGPEQVCAWARI
jgi:ubiquinone/menaquinone biosynthesis C-methylase UbiE